MKKILISLLILFLLISLLIFNFYFVVNWKGREILPFFLKKKLNLETKIEKVSLRFPFILKLKGFSLPNTYIEDFSFDLKFFNPFKQFIYIKEVKISKPSLKIILEKDKPQIPILPLPLNFSSNQEKNEIMKINILIDNFILENGKVEIILKGKKELDFSLENIFLNLNGFNYPNLNKFFIDLKSNLQMEGFLIDDFLIFKGWIDYFHKNMEANFKLKNLDFNLFNKIFFQFDLDKLGIEKFIFSLNVDFKGVNDDLSLDSFLNVDKISYRETAPELIKNTFSLLDKKENILNIKFKTKMTNPSFNFSFLNNLIREKIKEIISGKSKEILEETKEKIKDFTSEIKNTSLENLNNTIENFKEIFKK